MSTTIFSNADPASGLGVYLRLLGYVRGYAKYFLIAFVGMALYSLGDAGFAALVKPLFDESLIKQDDSVTGLLALLVVGVLFMRGLGAFLTSAFLAYVSEGITRQLRLELLRHMLRMEIGYYDANSSGKLISRLTFNVSGVSQALTKTLTVMIRDTLTALVLLGWMFYLSWALTLVLVLVSPLMGLLLVYVNKRFRSARGRLQDAMGLLTRDIEQMVRGIHVIKIFGNQKFESKEFERDNNAVYRYALKIARTKAMATPVAIFVIGLALAGVIFLLTSTSMTGQISVGGVASFFVSIVMLMRPVRSLIGINAIIQQGVVAARSVFDVLDMPPECDAGASSVKHFDGGIAFKNVSYRYPNGTCPSLSEVSLDIPPRAMVALVGASGAGKTTLAHMIPRFYRPDAGRIELDGTDINEIPLSELRRQIAYVGQHTILFHDTIRNNITCGREVSDEQLRAVIAQAHVSEIADKLPLGIDTVIGEDEGAQLSGGQSQRVAIARALLKDAAIIILDEATSFLDTESEKVIKNTLAEIAGGRTLIVIAHRLATVERADHIVVMDEGKIIEQGRHGELLGREGKYYRLCRAGQHEGILK